MTANEQQLAKAFRDAFRDNVVTKADLEQSLREAILSLKIWTAGAVALGLGALFAALRYWPPHP